MPTETLTIVISGDAATLIAALRASGVEVGKFGDETKDAGKHTTKWKSEVGGLARELGAGLALGAVVKSIGQFAVGAVQAADDSRVARSALIGLSGSAEMAAENLEATARATTVAGRVLVDETSRAEIANQLLGMGIANTSAELEKAIYVSRRLGATFRGLGAKEAANEFAIMMSNMSVVRLDSFGISSGKVRARIEELMATTKDMTREQAFFQATMEEAENTLGRLGPEIETNQQQAAAAAVSWQEFQVSMGELAQGLITLLGPAIEATTGLIGQLTEGAKAWQQILGMNDSSLESLAAQTGQYTTEAQRAAAGTEALAEAQAQAAEDAKKQAVAMRDLGMVETSYFSDATTAQADFLQSTMDYNHKRVEVMNEASQTIRANETDRAAALVDLQQQMEDERNAAIQQGNLIGAANLEFRFGTIEAHYQDEKTLTNQHYDEINASIKAKELQQIEDLKAAYAEQQRLFEEHIGELKLKTTLGMLEATGKLEELTGGVTKSADEAFDLIRAGLIPLNDEFARAIEEQNKKLIGSSNEFRSVAESNSSKLSGIFGQVISSMEKAEQKGYQVFNTLGQRGGGMAVPGFARGGDFTVPPGYPNDSFMMGVSSGERVTVAPQTNNYNLNVNSGMPSGGIRQDFESMRMMARN